MGQFTALLYKQWALTKKQRLSFGCQILSPMFSLGLIWAIIYVTGHTNPSSSDPESPYDPDGVIPTYVYPGYIANLQTRNYPFPFDFYNNWNPYRIFRYGYFDPDDESLVSKVSGMIDKPLELFEFSDGQRSPLFNYTENLNNPSNSNQVLVSDLRSLRNIPDDQLEFYQGVADAVVVFNQTRFDKGLALHLQVNNLPSEGHHRTNGVSRINMSNPQNSSDWISPALPTEGFVGTLNYFANKYLEYKRIGQPQRMIQGYVSLVYDSSSTVGLLQSRLASLSLVFFPIALSLGFPLLLFALVLEAEYKILALLRTNGLDTYRYWLSIYTFYFTMFTTISTIFCVLGWLFVDTTIFTDIPKIVLTVFFLGWNFSQISFGIFLSTLISSSAWANLIGYLISVLLLLAISGISFTVFPNPWVFPFYFYILPHSGFVRFFYSITFDCVSGSCPTSLFNLQGDALRSLLAIFASGLGYNLICWLMYHMASFSKLKVVKPDHKKAEKVGFKIEGCQNSVTANEGLALSNDATSDLFHREPLMSLPENTDPKDPRFAVVSIGLNKVYSNGKQALTDLNIRFRKGKIFALLGPNGAGKSTLLSIISGALEKTSGCVHFEGKEVTYGERNDAKMGFCPQFDILWPNLSIQEHFEFFTLFKGHEPSIGLKRYIEELSDSLGLSDALRKRVTQLSGGMRRRVSLGCAIAGDSSVIFLDEPSSGLDPVKRREFWNVIKKVAKDKAVVLTTHLMEEAEVLSDEIGIMISGQLRALGTAKNLKEKYGGGMKIHLMLSNPCNMEEVDKILNDGFKGMCSMSYKFDRSVTFTLRGNESHNHMMIKVFDIVTDLQTSNLIDDWSIGHGSLEEVFVRVLEQSSQKKFGL